MITVRSPLQSNIRIIAWFNFLLDLRFYAPILVVYFTSITNSYTLAMSIFSATMLSSALFEIPTGVLSDLIGRKKTLVYGALATLISVTLYATSKGIVWLYAGAVIEGVARALFSGNNDALLHESLATNQDELAFAQYSGKTESLSQLAIAVVSIIGGIIASYSFSLAMYLSIIPAFLGLVLALYITEPMVTGNESTGNTYSHLNTAVKLFITNKKLRLLSLSSILGYGQSEAAYQFRSAFFATLWPVWAIGIAKSLGSLGATLSFWFAGSLIKRFGEFRVLLFSKFYSLATNIVSTIFPSAMSPIIMSSNSLFFGSGSTASSSLKQREYGSKERATMASLDSLGGSLMYSLVAIFLGYVADIWSPALGILALQSLAAISLFITWYLYQNPHKNTIKSL